MTLSLSILLAVLAFRPQQQVDMRVLVEQALDAPLELTLENATLPELFDAIQKASGVRVVMDPRLFGLLPYGADTRVGKAEIRNTPLRGGLAAIFDGLGMTFVVNDRHDVEIIPKPALARLGRPATWPELENLSRLARLAPGRKDEDLQALRPLVQFRVRDSDPWSQLADVLRQCGAGPGDAVLDIACDRLGWTWFPGGDAIVVVSKQEQISRQLETGINVALRSRPLMEIVRAVGDSCGVAIDIDPAAFQGLPSDVRQSFTLTVEGFSAREALDAVAAQTGLTYIITAEGVTFYSASAVQPAGAAAPADPVIGLIAIELGGQTLHVLIRASDVPPESRALIEAARTRAVESLLRAVEAAERK
ncbi:MAG: hypothetical protein C4547_10545 [Phycisphaerales bacterium]|nr:MAG: hypothetical protein C4547_10545 [Phycisphaerales bacterium]